MRRLLTLIMLVFALVPLSGSALEAEWPSVTVDGHPGVVVPRDEAADAVIWVVWPDDDVEGYWLPGEPWLEKAEAAIAEEVGPVDTSDMSPVPATPILNGYRQYAGYIENGERKILVNSFCQEMGNWRSDYVIVMDGGSCFWNAVYNVDTGEVEHLYVNGNA